MAAVVPRPITLFHWTEVGPRTTTLSGGQYWIEVLGRSAELPSLHKAPAAKSTNASTAPTMTSTAVIIASRRAAVFTVLVIVLSLQVCDLARLLRETFAIGCARSQRAFLAAISRATSHCLL